MCLSYMSDNIEEKKQLHDFEEWILNIGDNKTSSNDRDELIKIPADLLLEKGDDSRKTIINNTYPDLLNNYKERSFLQERTILCVRNETVPEINDYIMTKLSGEEITYNSCDSVCETSTCGVDGLYPTEFLNTLKFPDIPNHELTLFIET
jgi:ATP-dependent DNA helicase PIF1